MDATLILQYAIDVLAADGKVDLLVAADSTLRGIRHAQLPSHAVAIALVHGEEVAREEASLVATRSRADLHLYILRILGILRHEQEFDLFLQLGAQLLVLGEFLARHLLHVGIALVGDDILGLADGVDAGDEALTCIHDVAEILVFLRKLDVASLVGDHVGVGDQGRHLLEARLQAVELFQYVVLICHYLW